jgi:hypothetical protein
MSYDATRRRLDALTDHVGFQDLVTILLARTGINVRPLGGPGDRGRDAVAGLYRAKGGEPLAVTISLERDWRAKIRADLKRIHDCGFRPKTAISVTNRQAAHRHAMRGQLRRHLRQQPPSLRHPIRQVGRTSAKPSAATRAAMRSLV